MDINSIIQAGGTIIAAVSGAFVTGMFAKGIVKNDVPVLIHTYSDKNHDVHKVIKRAKKSIYIVVTIGNHLLEEIEDDLRMCLKKGINVYFLMHNEERGHELKEYINGCELAIDHTKYRINEAYTILRRLKKDRLSGRIIVKPSSMNFTASYIAVDIDNAIQDGEIPPHALIQIMLYQYGVRSENSFLDCLSPKGSQEEVFRSTAKCISEMWNKGGEPISLDNINIEGT